MTDLLAALEARMREIAAEEIAKAQGSAAPSEYLTTEDAAAAAGLTPGTVRRWIRAGKLTGYRAGRRVRVQRDELARVLAAETAQPDASAVEAATRKLLRKLGI